MNTETNSLPVWYGGGLGNNRNARFYSVGHRKPLRALYYPKSKNIMSTQNKLKTVKEVKELFKRYVVPKSSKDKLNTFTLYPTKQGYTTNIKVDDFADLGTLIVCLLSVCRNSLANHDRCEDTSIEVSKVLEMIEDLIPHSELELVDRLQDEL